MYLDTLNPIIFPLLDGNTTVPFSVRDITARVLLNMSDKDLISVTSPYTILDGEAPEDISNKLYGNPHYFWVILIINNIYDVYSDWCLSQNELVDYCTDIYGDSINALVYLIDDYNNIVAPYGINDVSTATTYSGPVTAVSNFQWESILNEKKRVIRVLQPSYLATFVNMYLKKMSSAI